MFGKLLAFLLKLQGPKLELPTLEYPLAVQSDFPELSHIRVDFLKRINKSIRDLEIFCTMIQTLNDGLEDPRLENSGGAYQALRELREYGVITKAPQYIMFNSTLGGREKLPLVFFEV